MTLSRVFRLVRAAGLRAVTLAALLAVVTRSLPAHADNVLELIHQLENDSSDKVRLSAALNLTKLGDQRAILALVKAIANDGDKTVRGAAAVGLGELVSDKTKSSIKNLALSALKRAAASDESDFVRGQADKALKALSPGATVTPPPQTPGGSIYVNIGPMSSRVGNAGDDARLKALMVKIANKTMSKVANNMATSWPGGTPTQAMLDAKGAMGFYVDGTLNELKVKESGSSTTVSCKINMLLASYPDKSIFGLLNGGASVQASGSASDIALAREDCVSAVVEDLIAKKIVPTINTKAGAP
jgi:HEAT repeat protein